MTVNRLLQSSRVAVLGAVAAVLLLAGCAGTGGAQRPAGHSSSGIEVFGTIDASVSGERNRSGR